MKTPESEDPLLSKRKKLRARSESLHGHGIHHPAEELERVAAFLRDQDVEADVYGKGGFVEAFESEVAQLLGKEAARFMPSGCMAQPIALRIWADRAGNRHTAFHPTSHLELHEEKGYAKLHGLEAHLLGDASRPTLAADLEGLPALSSLLLELPAREIGGQLPSWPELLELVGAARSRQIRLHLDGARLWEAQSHYDRPFAEICDLFDSVYVSFYKGIGALAGAMLLGPRDFVDEAITWQRRQGGTLFSALPNIVSAQTRLRSQIEKMPAYRDKAREIALLWKGQPRIRLIPDPPQVNMFHLVFDADSEMVCSARDEVAEKHGIWLMGNPRPHEALLSEGSDRAQSRVEISIGEAALGVPPDRMAEAITALSRLID